MPKATFGPSARAKVRDLLGRVLEQASKAFAGGRRRQLHALRIAAKRLRYNLEFAAALAPDDALPALDVLARLQDRLGAVADADTFGQTYTRLLNAVPAGDPRRLGLESLREAARLDRARVLDEARALWEGDPRYPDRLAASISSALGSGSPKPEP